MNKEERNEILFELKLRKSLLSKLETIQRQYQTSIRKEQQKREDRLKETSLYQTEDEIQDAYGYGEITYDERDTLLRQFAGAQEPDTTSLASCALSYVNALIRQLQGEEAELQYSLLSEEEQAKRDERAEETQRRIQVRKGKKVDEK